MQHAITLLIVIVLGVPALQLPVILERLTSRALGGDPRALWLAGGVVLVHAVLRATGPDGPFLLGFADSPQASTCRPPGSGRASRGKALRHNRCPPGYKTRFARKDGKSILAPMAGCLQHVLLEEIAEARR
jgi:hypothetical protein